MYNMQPAECEHVLLWVNQGAESILVKCDIYRVVIFSRVWSMSKNIS